MDRMCLLFKPDLFQCRPPPFVIEASISRHKDLMVMQMQFFKSFQDYVASKTPHALTTPIQLKRQSFNTITQCSTTLNHGHHCSPTYLLIQSMDFVAWLVDVALQILARSNGVQVLAKRPHASAANSVIPSPTDSEITSPGEASYNLDAQTSSRRSYSLKLRQRIR